MSLPFVSLAGRARWATSFLVVTMLVDLVVIGADIHEVNAIDRFLAGTNLDVHAVTSSHDFRSIVVAIKLLVLAVCGVAFIRWFHAAYRNVTLLAPRDVTFKPGWAIGGWFVPILGLWRPKQIADEIWHASELQPAPTCPQSDRLGKTTTVLTLWWTLWIVSGIGRASPRLFFGGGALGDIRNADKLDIAALLLDIAAALLAVLVIQRITSRLAGTTAPPPGEVDLSHHPGLPPLP